MSKNGKLIFKDYDPYITSPFGWRKDPISGATSFHSGTDYGTYGKELPQYALEKGKVVGCGTDGYGGKYVYVKYDRLNHIALHYHLSEILVVNGQDVDNNTKIGITGTTGRSTGVHLHYGWFNISEWNKSARKYEDFELYDIPKEEPAPVPTTRFKEGDTVKILKVGNGASDGKSNVAYGIGWQRTITKVYPNKPFPNQVGSMYGTVGFYADDALEAITANETVNLGDTVVVNGYGTANSGGLGNKTEVFKNVQMKVLAILKNAKRPYALNKNNEGKIGNFKEVTAWFSKEDIKKK